MAAWVRTLIGIGVGLLLFLSTGTLAGAQEPDRSENAVCPTGSSSPRALVAGDSWAQFMWDDGSHNDLFERFGHGDKLMISESLSSNPGPGYTGSEYAISGSQARHWADSANYPWIANTVAALQANPTVDTVLLSIGGNDILDGRTGDGWYKDMELDMPGSEEALFSRVESDTWTIISATLALRPDLDVVISSYDYPNLNTGFLYCWLYACPLRDRLSRDPDGDPITDAEINAMMVMVEQRRIDWANSSDRVAYDNSMGLMHYFYGDGINSPGTLPYPGQSPPDYLPYPGGNPQLPSLRENFRSAPDPIHLDYEGYRYKIAHELAGYFLPRWRGTPAATFFSQGAIYDGWADGINSGNGAIRVGDNGTALTSGIVSFDTSALPDGALVTGASLYLQRSSSSGSNPFASGSLGQPQLDVVAGSFGAPAVEAADATAPATASNAGCAHGRVVADQNALRIDITTEGLAALNKDGLTQFRLHFTTVNPDLDEVAFAAGDAGPDDNALDLPSLADYVGTAAPFLDVDYCLAADTITGLGGAVDGDTLSLEWNPVEGALAYEVWWSDNPGFEPGDDCEGEASCTLVTGPAFSETVGDGPGFLGSYRMRARNGCALVAPPSGTVGVFTFSLTSGSHS